MIYRLKTQSGLQNPELMYMRMNEAITATAFMINWVNT